MANVTVFVDDAVRGRLPAVCVKEGVATTDRLRVNGQVGSGTGLGVAWLLVLAGPLGWVGLFVISLLRSAEVLPVELPYSEPAYRRLQAARSSRYLPIAIACGLAAVVGVAAFVDAMSPPIALLLLLVVGAAVVVTIMRTVRLNALTVRVQLDVSRRWVTLYGVHPDFAAAAQAQTELLR